MAKAWDPEMSKFFSVPRKGSGSIACDRLQGFCCCGTYHYDKEFKVEESAYRVSGKNFKVTKNKKWSPPRASTIIDSPPEGFEEEFTKAKEESDKALRELARKVFSSPDISNLQTATLTNAGLGEIVEIEDALRLAEEGHSISEILRPRNLSNSNLTDLIGSIDYAHLEPRIAEWSIERPGDSPLRNFINSAMFTMPSGRSLPSSGTVSGLDTSRWGGRSPDIDRVDEFRRRVEGL